MKYILKWKQWDNREAIKGFEENYGKLRRCVEREKLSSGLSTLFIGVVMCQCCENRCKDLIAIIGRECLKTTNERTNEQSSLSFTTNWPNRQVFPILSTVMNWLNQYVQVSTFIRPTCSHFTTFSPLSRCKAIQFSLRSLSNYSSV